MTQQIANSQSVIWSVIIVGVLLAIGMFFSVNSINNNSVNVGVDVERQIDQRFDTSFAELKQLTDSFNEGNQSIEVSGLEGLSDLCRNTDGCGGWWDAEDRDKVAKRVTDELTESDNKDLYREIRKLVDVDEKEDIISVDVHRLGEIRTNEDPSHGLSNSRIITIDYVLEVEFYEDGSNTETKTKYFRFQATLDDLEDGLTDADVEITSVELVSKRFALP